ncbi:MFS transporter [Undibacterium parvum]|uniref:MFS transporter n=1 Tax=Undibacterium parvum TaxID=401471 RepID=A0A3S9HJN6_9BURK|nr:MFS transporter [Undibacterium parvum]AZP12320.1 MFS transporter [Undibacterium parvum]
MHASPTPAALPAQSLIYPHIPLWVAVVIACVASFMVVMDGAIVNVALPAMQADLGLSKVQQQWVVDAYLLCLGGCMLLAARASDLYGRKRILQSGLLVFTAASLAGGLASTPAALLIARAIQGFGASALATSTLAVIVAVYPGGPAKARAISMWAASSAIASALGVLIGGLLTEKFGWRWVMFVNVPIGCALIAGVALCMQARDAGNPPARLDVWGALSITLGTAALLFGITQAVTLGWGSPTVLVALASAWLLIMGFIWIQAKTKHALIPLSIFQLHSVRIGNVVVLALGAALTASTFFLSIVLQQILGYSPLDTGLALLPMGTTLAIAAIVSRPLMDGGFRRLPFLGGLISAAGLAWLSRLPLQPNYLNDILGPTLLTGLGLGLMLMTSAHTALAGVPAKLAGLASGLFNTSRQLGAALGVASLSTLAHSITEANSLTQAAMPAQLLGYQGAFLGTAALCILAALSSLSLKIKPEN